MTTGVVFARRGRFDRSDGVALGSGDFIVAEKGSGEQHLLSGAAKFGD
jgi:hypothetical protein